MNLFISEISDEIKKIITYVSDVNDDNIRLLYSEKTRFDPETQKVLGHIFKTAENVSHRPTNTDECCIKWDKNAHKVEYVGEDVSHAIKALWGRENINIIGLAESRQIFFFEASHKTHLPDTFYHLNSISSYEQFMLMLKECDIEPFSLKDSSLFSHHRDQYYKHKETGCYWYLDTVHKDHYEVFDPTGKRHLAEATIQGNIDTTKADPDKKKITL